MKKILSVVLTLAMMLTLLNVGFVASAASDIPARAIAIDSVDALANMKANKVYKLTADIYVGTETSEYDQIVIPEGVTLYGNGYTIYQNYYVHGESGESGETKSLAWTHAMFSLSSGDMITLCGVKIGSAELPVYLSDGAEGPATNALYGIFRDTAGSVVNWVDVVFYAERSGKGLSSMNMGVITYDLVGTHTFDGCTANLNVNAGSQLGGWFYTASAAAALSMTDCTSNGALFGSYVAGYIHSPNCDVTMIDCVNNATVNATYSSAGGFFSGFVGNFGGSSLYMEGCVNNADMNVTALTIGGAILGRTVTGIPNSIQLVDCINNGDIATTGGTTSNHGFGGIAGHTNANLTYEILGCINMGSIKGTGNLGGIVGFCEGAALKVFSNCKNYGDLTASDNVEAAGIVAQLRGSGDLTGCTNFGDINAAKQNAGILGKGFTDSAIIDLYKCVNYGTVGNESTTHAGGLIALNGANLAYTLDECVNYGKILTRQYSGGMVAENGGATFTVQNCINYGEIVGVHAVAGFFGQTGNSANAVITITESLNAGNVHELKKADGSVTPGEGLGGFFGRIAGTLPIITITDSANTGTVTGSTKVSNVYGSFGDTFGQFIGLYTVSAKAYNYVENDLVGGFHNWNAETAVKPVLNNCYAYGAAVPGTGAKSLTGWITKDASTGQAFGMTSSYIASTIAVTEAPNNGIYGINVQIDETSTVSTLPTNSDEAIATMKDVLGIDMIAGAKGENPLIVATPAIRGYQQSLDGENVRLLAAINSASFEAVGFIYSVSINGFDVVSNVSANCTYILENVNVADGEGNVSKISAASLFAKYLSAITFNGIPAEGTVVITVAPTADAFVGTAYEITIVNAVVTGCVAK